MVRCELTQIKTAAQKALAESNLADAYRARCVWVELKPNPEKQTERHLRRVIHHNESYIDMLYRGHSGSAHGEERMYELLAPYTNELARRAKLQIPMDKPMEPSNERVRPGHQQLNGKMFPGTFFDDPIDAAKGSGMAVSDFLKKSKPKPVYAQIELDPTYKAKVAAALKEDRLTWQDVLHAGLQAYMAERTKKSKR